MPVVDDEGLAIAKGSEIEGAEALPPTLAGWRRYLEVAPKSGESFGTLREAGLRWWGRKIPPNLLSAAKDAEAEAEEHEAPSQPVAAPSAPQADAVQPSPAASEGRDDNPRPQPAPARGDRAAAKALVRRLNLMPQGVRLGSGESQNSCRLAHHALFLTT